MLFHKNYDFGHLFPGWLCGLLIRVPKTYSRQRVKGNDRFCMKLSLNFHWKWKFSVHINRHFRSIFSSWQGRWEESTGRHVCKILEIKAEKENLHHEIVSHITQSIFPKIVQINPLKKLHYHGDETRETVAAEEWNLEVIMISKFHSSTATVSLMSSPW